MAGIYLHIPFCKQKCTYCDFHFSTSLKHKDELIEALLKEIKLRKQQLNTPIKTLYFGGGTPSILSIDDLKKIVNNLYEHYSFEQQIEFTLECNPDDITPNGLIKFKELGINRLSIGVQSFFDDDLVFFNRAHNSQQAKESILMSQNAGFNNISIDLIYSSPLLNAKKWEQNLAKIEELHIPHLSAYTLTVENNTALHHQVKMKQVKIPTEEKTIQQYEMLIKKTQQFGLKQYEISNFGKEGYFSQHNSNYWKGEEYLGFGPSAHSYVKKSSNNSTQTILSKRCWNVSNNIKYIKALHQNLNYFEEEIIDEKTAYNEYILTGLRTIWGINKHTITINFNEDIIKHFNLSLRKYLKTPYLNVEKNKISLTPKGLLIADFIAKDLFL